MCLEKLKAIFKKEKHTERFSSFAPWMKHPGHGLKVYTSDPETMFD